MISGMSVVSVCSNKRSSTISRSVRCYTDLHMHKFRNITCKRVVTFVVHTEYGQYTKHIRVNCKTVDMAVGDFFFTPWVLLLITKECHDKFFIDFNFFDGKFSRNILITKVLSYMNIRASEMEIHYIDKVDVAK